MPQPEPRGRRLRLVGWLLVPLLAWALGYAAFVLPARRQLANAQQALLAAEREALDADAVLAREQALSERMRQEIQDLSDAAERMRAAESAAEARLMDTRERQAWLLPGESARVNL
jgi:hypothetical protein